MAAALARFALAAPASLLAALARFALAAALLAATAALAPASQAQQFGRLQQPALNPGPDAATRIQSALLLAKPGDTVLLAAGVFRLSQGLVMSVEGVTLKGAGPLRTVLQFDDPTDGSGGLVVVADGVTVEGLALEDPGRFGMQAQNCTGLQVRQLRVEWQGESGQADPSGLVGVHITQCSQVLMEGVTVHGAAAAGIQVEQTGTAILRDSRVEDSGIGVALVNSRDLDLYQSAMRRNTAGVLVVNLPSLNHADVGRVRVFRNTLEDNNRAFAEQGLLALVASGMGVAVMAGQQVEVFGNRLRDHGSAALAVLSYPLGFAGETYSPASGAVQLHDNLITNAAYAPDHGRLAAHLEAGGGELAAILWDGAGDFWENLGLGQRRRRLLLSNNSGGSFLDTDMVWFLRLRQLHNPSRDDEKHCGEVVPLPPVRLGGGS